MKHSNTWSPNRNNHTSGFSLVEVLIALAMFAIVCLGLIGLLGVGIANNQTSTEQTMANTIAASIMADLQSTPASSPTQTSTRFGLTLPAITTSFSLTPLQGVIPFVLYFDNTGTFIAPLNPGNVPTNAIYAVHVYLARLQATGPLPSQCNDMARVVVSWPAQATTTPSGSVDLISQFLVR